MRASGLLSAAIFLSVVWGCEKQAFITQDVQYANGELSIGARLYLPASGNPTTAVIMVPSAEPDTRETFAEYGEELAARGLAVLCYDKRGAGTSTGNVDLAGFYDLYDDAAAGVQFLQEASGLALQHIGLMGHSQGGMYVFLADTLNTEVDFVIDFSGSPGTPLAQSHYNIYSRITGLGGSANYAEDLADLMDAYIIYLHEREHYDSLRTEWQRLQTHPERALANEIHYFDQFTYFLPPAEMPAVDATPMYPFMRSYQYHASAFIPHLTIPALVIYGTEDKVIPAMACADSIRALQKTQPLLDLRTYAGANHGMKIKKAGRAAFPETYFDDVYQWITTHTNNTR